jgi:hypothetical protein
MPSHPAAFIAMSFADDEKAAWPGAKSGIGTRTSSVAPQTADVEPDGVPLKAFSERSMALG